MKKILLWIGAALIVLLVVAVVVVSMSLDGAIKKGVESYGPQLTQVSVKLDAVNLSLMSGSGGIKGLLLGNPEGFKTPHAISVGSASLALKPTSLLSDKIVVKSIRIEAPDINFEAGLGGSNLGKILSNVEAATGGSAATTNAAAAEAGPGKKLQVDEFVLTGAKVSLSLAGTGGKAMTVNLPDIRLANLGTGPDGITAGELTRLVMSDIVKAALKAAADAGYDVSKLTENLKQELDKNVQKLTRDLAGTNSHSVSNLTKSIGDLFKKK